MTVRLAACLSLWVAAVAAAQGAPAVPASAFSVASEPPGATVEVSPPGDPRFYAKGLTPCEITVERALPGEWAVRLSLPGHIPSTRVGSLPVGELQVQLQEATTDASPAYPIAIELATEPRAVVITPALGGDPLARIENATGPLWSPVLGRLAFRRGSEAALWTPAGERSLGAMAGGRLAFTPDGEFLTTVTTRRAGTTESAQELVLVCRPVGGGDDRTFVLGEASPELAPVLDYSIDRTGEAVAVAFAPASAEDTAPPVTLYRLARDRAPAEVALPEGLPSPTAVAFDPVLPALWMLIPRDPGTDRPARAIQYITPGGLIAIQTPPPGADDFETVERLAFSPAGRWLVVSGGTSAGPRVMVLPWRVVGQAPTTHEGLSADWCAYERDLPA